ncbi:family 43 glycosylhydrolase [Flavisolibacter sp. BT320]|nr:family 43 glycosylhydrolase [Flavisolibacter longurius]
MALFLVRTALLYGSFLLCKIGNAQNSTQADTTFVADGNPIIRHKFTADPAALVYKDKVYLYTGHDQAAPKENRYVMHEWLCFSSPDMKTWTEHPSPLNVKSFAWAKGDAWASQVIERDGKFWWYVSIEHATIRGKAIGVAVSDSPTGPFVDALGKALITNDMTKEAKISWDDIDPTVWIENGQAYLFWGNTTLHYVKLKPNMIEMDGPFQKIDVPKFTEAPYIHKRKDWFYLTYATVFPEKTAYAMSRSIEGPWTYKGLLGEIPGNSNTAHQSIIAFKGRWYFVYHNGALVPDAGSFHRSVCIDHLYYNNDGTLKRVVMTSEGIPAAK